jgi:hypothetical protein
MDSEKLKRRVRPWMVTVGFLIPPAPRPAIRAARFPDRSADAHQCDRHGSQDAQVFATPADRRPSGGAHLWFPDTQMSVKASADQAAGAVTLIRSPREGDQS